MSSVDDAFLAAESLAPDEKLQLISRIWDTIPPTGTFRPSDSDLAEINRRWAEYEAGREKAIPWEEVWEETQRELNERHES